MTTKPTNVKLIECPRDAMQGLAEFIPTETKVNYINQLLKVGFDTIDFGSFVSAKAVPQMSDTAEVLKRIDIKNSRSKLLAIIANERGAEEASSYEVISYLGFPLSLSETFQQKNTNKSVEQAFSIVENAQSLCLKTGKELVVYLSMGFGNPYGDEYNPEFVLNFVKRLSDLGINIISLSDTVGVADEEIITNLFSTLIPAYPNIEFGAHLHSNPIQVETKLKAAFLAGCKRFDSAMRGFGGCPMAKDELVGNLPTEQLIHFFKQQEVDLKLNEVEFRKSHDLAGSVFPI